MAFLQTEPAIEKPTSAAEPVVPDLATWSTKLDKLIREPNYQPADLKGLAKKLGVQEENYPG